MKNKLVADALVLTVITLVAGLGLGVVYEITKEPIAKAEQDALNRSYKAVFEEAETFEDYEDFDSEAALAAVEERGIKGVSIEFCETALDSNDERLGYVIGVKSSGGYGGPISFSVGITNDGEINGYSVTTINETAGLGMKAKDTGEKSFAAQWAGMEASYDNAVTKDGGSVVPISGATITSRCMTKGVNGASAYFDTIKGGE